MSLRKILKLAQKFDLKLKKIAFISESFLSRDPFQEDLDLSSGISYITSSEVEAIKNFVDRYFEYQNKILSSSIQKSAARGAHWIERIEIGDPATGRLPAPAHLRPVLIREGNQLNDFLNEIYNNDKLKFIKNEIVTNIRPGVGESSYFSYGSEGWRFIINRNDESCYVTTAYGPTMTETRVPTASGEGVSPNLMYFGELLKKSLAKALETLQQIQVKSRSYDQYEPYEQVKSLRGIRDKYFRPIVYVPKEREPDALPRVTPGGWAGKGKNKRFVPPMRLDPPLDSVSELWANQKELQDLIKKSLVDLGEDPEKISNQKINEILSTLKRFYRYKPNERYSPSTLSPSELEETLSPDKLKETLSPDELKDISSPDEIKSLTPSAEVGTEKIVNDAVDIYLYPGKYNEMLKNVWTDEIWRNQGTIGRPYGSSWKL
ncbi:hypothetical protein EBU91_04195 [bacterium]|nr:hypothetical protein [bacterium]